LRLSFILQQVCGSRSVWFDLTDFKLESLSSG
jgi:hypothetical protein